MRFVECAQSTEQWHAARCGVITASRFADAISMVGELDERQQAYVDLVLGGADKKAAAAKAGYKSAPTSTTVARVLDGGIAGVPSDVAIRYAADLAIEQISRKPHGEPPKAWVLERGHTMEAAARRIYEARTGAFVTEAGLCLTDDGAFGYSTDGLVDDDGLIEVKAPIDSAKILHIIQTGDVSDYLHQMQGGMWITGRAWCDFIMYVPDLENANNDLYVRRIARNDAFIDAMVLDLVRFQQLVGQQKAIAYGRAA